MAKPFSKPDPKDRSVNEPSVIMETRQVLGLYNQEENEERERVTDNIKKWYEEEMKKEGWHKVEFHGSQCVLTANVTLN